MTQFLALADHSIPEANALSSMLTEDFIGKGDWDFVEVLSICLFG